MRWRGGQKRLKIIWYHIWTIPISVCPLTLFYMGGKNLPPVPWWIIAQQSSLDAPNGLIFHDFVPSNIRKVLERPFLEIVLKISKILASTIFSELNPKGGPFYAKVKKSKKSNFFCSKSYFFYLNMNYKCSKLSIEVSDMSYNQFLVILSLWISTISEIRILNPHVTC